MDIERNRILDASVTGEQAVDLVQSELMRLFQRQRCTSFISKYNLITPSAMFRNGAQEIYPYELDSAIYLALMQKRGKIKNWLVPEPESFLHSFFVDKIIITYDLQAIPFGERLSHAAAKNRKKKIKALYRQSANKVLPVLTHKIKGGDLANQTQMFTKLESILQEGPHLSLFSS